MFKKLADVEKKFEKLSSDLQAPGVTDDPASYRKLMKEYAELEKIVVVFRRYKLVQKNIEENKVLLGSEKDEFERGLRKYRQVPKDSCNRENAKTHIRQAEFRVRHCRKYHRAMPPVSIFQI